MYGKAAVALVALVMNLPTTAQDIYVGDPAHTIASFETGHLGISWVRGRFDKTTTARVVLDRAARKGSIDVVIDVTSVDTGHGVRDQHLRSNEYFDVEKFPTISFKSNSLRFEGANLVAADGDLTIMGVTKPVTLTVRCFAASSTRSTKRICAAPTRTPRSSAPNSASNAVQSASLTT